MRIVIGTPFLTVVGGAEKYLQHVIPALIERKHSVGILHEGSFTSGEDVLDIPGRCTKWSISESGVESALAQIVEWRPDLIYWHSLRSEFLESTLISRYPSILHVHNYEGTCATGTKLHSFPIISPCARKIGPTCLLLHYPRRCGGLNPLTAIAQYRLQMQRNSTLNRYSAVLVASNHMFKELTRNRVSTSRLYHLPFPPTDFSPLPDTPKMQTPRGRILYIGRLTKLKGVHYLISAVSLAQTLLGVSLCLTVAGSGPEEVSLRKDARNCRFEMDFVGWANRDSRRKLIENSDLLAVPSVWPEPFGLVGIEAACFGVPSIAFNVGGISDWLKPGETGELASGSRPTVPDLADAIVRALKDPVHYNRLRVGAWKNATAIAQQDHCAKLEAIFRSCMNQGQLQ